MRVSAVNTTAQSVYISYFVIIFCYICSFRPSREE